MYYRIGDKMEIEEIEKYLFSTSVKILDIEKYENKNFVLLIFLLSFYHQYPNT